MLKIRVQNQQECSARSALFSSALFSSASLILHDLTLIWHDLAMTGDRMRQIKAKKQGKIKEM